MMVSALTSLASAPSPDPRMMATCGGSDVRRRTTDTAPSIFSFRVNPLTLPALFQVSPISPLYPDLPVFPGFPGHYALPSHLIHTVLGLTQERYEDWKAM